MPTSSSVITSKQVRRQFIDFFVEKHGHAFVPSSPVVPHDDPTLLFTNAGMNQFKPYFLGTEQAPWKRVANTQKCIRAGGKHNDLDDVGRSRRHHTFFEMLGNWSFGDYFKQGAIEMSWELLTKVWGLDPTRLHVSCFEGDEKNGVPRDTEAADIWRKVANWEQYGLNSDDHIHYFGKDNFWEMGDTGPCGPCTEIYYDRTPDKSGGPQVNGDDPRVMEIWNNVFIQYNRNADRSLTTLPSKHVDTGMGFERITQVLQDKPDNYAIDLWDPFFDAIAKLSGRTYTGLFPPTNAPDPEAEAANPQLRTDIAFRVIADHIRCLTFAITDGATPSNDGRGYVLRRILRRAVRFGRQQLDLHEPFMHTLVPVVVESMGEAFPELKADPQRVAGIIRDEEESFGRTLDRGIALFEDAAKRGGKRISAEDAFKLYDTYGFPIDLTQVMAAERGLDVDMPGAEALMEEARQKSRGGGDGAVDPRQSLVEVVQTAGLPATEFVGYEQQELPKVSTSVKLFAETDRGFVVADEAQADQRVAVVVEKTPFYGEAGGQVGDSGVLQVLGGGRVQVENTLRLGDVTFHIGKVVTPIRAADRAEVALAVDRVRRAAIMANHTTTHVMNHKLRAVLGDHVQQKGSLVDESRLRFDFAHPAPMSPEEIEKVEQMVTHDITADLPVYYDYAPIEKARPINTLRAVFGEKYPPVVRVVSIGVPLKDLLEDPQNAEWMNYSVEFCGGTHLKTTGEAEGFVIVAEEGVAKGVRRITALTGAAAHQAEAEGERLLNRVAAVKNASPDETRLRNTVAEVTKALSETPLPVLTRAELQKGLRELQDALKAIEKERSKASAADVVGVARQIADEHSGEVIVTTIPNQNADALRTAMDVIRKKRPESALLLASALDDKVALVASVPEAKIKKGLKAGDWVREVAKVVGGGGGGRPDMAQAGGKDPSKIEDALKTAREFAASKL